MNAVSKGMVVSEIAAGIAVPARTRMLYALMDGRARTATELALIAGVNPSTASTHLAQLMKRCLVTASTRGRYRYYTLGDQRVAEALESLMVVAGGRSSTDFVPTTPADLRGARTCYDHMAGTLAVKLHDVFLEQGWLHAAQDCDDGYEISKRGRDDFEELGIDVAAAEAQRRRFAYGCLDWSERTPHLAGALGAGLLQVALRRKWVYRDLDSRALSVTTRGRREFRVRFGISVP